MQTKSKIGLALAIILAGPAYFTATQPITPRLAVVSSISVVFFALPSYWAVISAKGRSRGALTLFALGIYALVIESLAIRYGIPYGRFVYTELLGNKVFGLTPWTVAFAYPPILLLTYWYARKRHTNRWKIYVSTAFDAMLIDLVLDPAAVRLGFWHWAKPGFFYGVPLINFLGWLLSGLLGAILLHYAWRQQYAVPASVAYSGLAILWFWTCVNLWLYQWIPCAIGVAISVFLTRAILLKTDTIKQ